MSAYSSRPSGTGAIRVSNRHLGVPASYIILSLIVANQAAARTDTSLPYLVQSAPEELRFAQLRPEQSRPVRPVFVEKPAETPHETPSVLEQPIQRENHSGDPPGAQSTPTSKSAKPVQPADPMTIVPDTYAPTAGVRIEDLLPFFVAPTPPQAPASRATYEVK